mmetsp:Transcript_574/g.1111  ORF Transcript_574/g.1111 Transcript_574/m.1111 type:complete len:230 (-) Transcript_574:13-702(-)
MALTNSEVLPEPPTSGVRYSFPPSLYIAMTAFEMRSASWLSLRYRSIMQPLKIVAVGFATFRPASCVAACRAPCSNIAPDAPMFIPGNNPGPPTSPVARFVTMFPYKLGRTITSNCCGLLVICMHALSTIIPSNSIPGYFFATSAQHLRNNPSAAFMMFALCTAVTFLRPFITAYLNAYSAIRVLFSAEMILSDSTTPGTTSCSRPEYSPSVFSRITTVSTFLCLVSRP